MYWSWADPTRLLVHSGGEGIAGFFGEVSPDGVATEPAAILAGAFRAPAVSSDGRFRAFAAAGDGTRQQIVLETRDRTDSHAVDVFGMAAVAFGAGSNDLAFVAPAEPGRDVALPVGPLRLMDGASGRVRTLLDGTVLAFYWAPDGKTIAAIGVPAPGDDKVAGADRATLISTRSAPAAAAPAVKLRLSFINAETGRDPLALDVRRLGRLRQPGPPLLRPVRPQPPLCGRRMARRSPSRSSPTTAATR